MLTQRQTLSIGVLTPQPLSVIFSNPFFGAFAEGVAVVAEESGYGLTFISPLDGSLARAVGRATVDGVVAVGLTDDHPEVEQIRPGRPADRAHRLERATGVRVDRRRRRGRARAAAEHLIGLGHREFLVIGVEPPPTTLTEPEGVLGRRLRGYREALARVGIEFAGRAHCRRSREHRGP